MLSTDGTSEGQPTPAEPHQDSGYVVAFSPAAAEVPVASTRINVSETVRNIGVVIDSQLSLCAQVAAVCHSRKFLIMSCVSRPSKSFFVIKQNFLGYNLIENYPNRKIFDQIIHKIKITFTCTH